MPSPSGGYRQDPKSRAPPPVLPHPPRGRACIGCVESTTPRERKGLPSKPSGKPEEVRRGATARPRSGKLVLLLVRYTPVETLELPVKTLPELVLRYPKTYCVTHE